MVETSQASTERICLKSTFKGLEAPSTQVCTGNVYRATQQLPGKGNSSPAAKKQDSQRPSRWFTWSHTDINLLFKGFRADKKTGTWGAVS